MTALAAAARARARAASPGAISVHMSMGAVPLLHTMMDPGEHRAAHRAPPRAGAGECRHAEAWR